MADATGLVSPAQSPVAPTSQQAPAITPQAPAPDPSQTPSPQDDKLPPELLKIHAMQALVAGNPPALSAHLKDFGDRKEAKVIREHADLLKQAGFGFYRSLDGHRGVIFNAMHIHPADLMAADKAGKLSQIAPPFDVVDHAVSKSGMHNPVLKAQSVPNAPAAPTMQAPPQATAQMAPGAQPQPVKQTAAGAQRKALAARIGNIQPGSPTSGPFPGAGRLLNQIYKPVV